MRGSCELCSSSTPCLLLSPTGAEGMRPRTSRRRRCATGAASRRASGPPCATGSGSSSSRFVADAWMRKQCSVFRSPHCSDRPRSTRAEFCKMVTRRTGRIKNVVGNPSRSLAGGGNAPQAQLVTTVRSRGLRRRRDRCHAALPCSGRSREDCLIPRAKLGWPSL